ncbi:DUF1289 domain-containing protein [Sedimentitalea sp. CY04]|uniref:DUF1289 domain-containing protein n=1 Tax=Parasedimentitalea denitrificans TaxID=2211118 RepID=A0ABX0W4Y7_9RHOB|nr:DUF1289 domain-containing protein [Sedimentitalea sp. CY04]NIZ60698.1 DUF1289 domain-containing protein [Sedimentitalea sp. CY04]
MDRDVWKREEVDSPCTQVCVVHPATQLCAGCARSMDEISRWSQMSATERREITADLPNRTAVPKKRRGGRGGRSLR